MRSKYHRVHYRAMPAQSRFGIIFGVLHNEACYTQEELQFRTRVLVARTNSGLDADLLQTSNSWFANDQNTAFENINENSWFFNPEYLPRQTLSAEDFHIGLLDNQRLSWSGLATMTRVIGDYLLLRNSNLASSHFNQPMNYVLLDVVQVLKRLSMANNADYVTRQLQLLHNYLRVVEIHTSPTMGSDRLFLTDCRQTIENQQKEIESQIHTRQLKTRIHQVQQQLNQVAELRHTILHFALVDQPVNPHPYWEHFTTAHPQLDSRKEFPTLAAKACATTVPDALATVNENDSRQRFAALELTADTLTNCQDFKFVSSVPESVKTAYSNSLVDLQEILRFQGILDQLQHLFEQAGEVFTVIQFRQQMLTLLTNIEQFIHYSQQNILLVIEANANLYHEYIQAKQDLHWWEKLLTKRQAQIDDFIKNQDNLARFDTTPTDLHLACKELLQQVNQVVNQLTQQASENSQLELVSTTRQLVQQLMNSMQAWIGRQHELKGLPIPKMPSLIESPQSSEPEPATPSQIKPSAPRSNLPEEIIQVSSARQLTPFLFWSSPPSSNSPGLLCADGVNCVHPSGPPMISTGEINQENSSPSSTQPTLNTNVALGLLVLLPIGILALKVIYDTWQKPAIIRDNDPTNFDTLKIKAADLLSLANNLVKETADPWHEERLYFINNDYNALLSSAENGKFDITEMQNLYEELEDLHRDLMEDSTQIKLSN